MTFWSFEFILRQYALCLCIKPYCPPNILDSALRLSLHNCVTKCLITVTLRSVVVSETSVNCQVTYQCSASARPPVRPSPASSVGPNELCGVSGPGYHPQSPGPLLPGRQPLLQLWTRPAVRAALLTHRPAAPRQPAAPPTCSPPPKETRRREALRFNLPHAFGD